MVKWSAEFGLRMVMLPQGKHAIPSSVAPRADTSPPWFAHVLHLTLLLHCIGVCGRVSLACLRAIVRMTMQAPLTRLFSSARTLCEASVQGCIADAAQGRATGVRAHAVSQCAWLLSKSSSEGARHMLFCALRNRVIESTLTKHDRRATCVHL